MKRVLQYQGAGFLLTKSRKKSEDMAAQDTRKSGGMNDIHGSLSDVEA